MKSNLSHWLLLAAAVHTEVSMSMQMSSTLPRTAAQELGSQVHIAYSSDSGGFIGLLASMLSVARTAASPGDCTIHVLVPPEDMGKAEDLVKCFNNELQDLQLRPTVELLELKPLTFDLSKGIANPGTHWWRPAAFARLYLPEYMPHVPRVIWLDVDTIAQADLIELYRFPMKHSVAAVVELRPVADLLAAMVPQRVQWLRPSRSKWFNSGVLLMDLDKWRARGSMYHFDKLFNMTEGAQGDEFLLNLEFRTDYDRLDPIWNLNCMGYDKLVDPKAVPRARILHYSCNNRKPWEEPKPKELVTYTYLWEKHAPKKHCSATPHYANKAGITPHRSPK